MVIRVGLIGHGLAGAVFHEPLIEACHRLELAAVLTSHEHPMRARSLDELLDRSDLVVVASPNQTHFPLASAALDRGKHVVVDKPFALDLAEARDLVRTAEQADRQLWVFHNRRWDSDYLTIKAAIEGGIIGRVTHFESKIDRFRPEVRDRWRERADPGGGIWFDLGPHLIDQALQLFGLPDRVIASVASQRDGSHIDDWAHVILTYGERRVVLQGAMLAAGGSARFVVHGTGGSLVKLKVDQQETQLIAGMRPGEHDWGSDADPLAIYGPQGEQSIPSTPGDQRRFYELVVNALQCDGLGPVRPIEALAVMAVIEAGVVSARDGVAMPLSLTDEDRTVWGSAS